MNPDLYSDFIYDIDKELVDNLKGILKTSELGDVDNLMKQYISTLNTLKNTTNKLDNERKVSLRELIELYLNCLLLGYMEKLNIEEKEFFLHQIKNKLKSEKKYYYDNEITLFFDINKLNKILFFMEYEESIENLELLTAQLLKIINKNNITYKNPNEKIITEDLLTSLLECC